MGSGAPPSAPGGLHVTVAQRSRWSSRHLPSRDHLCLDETDLAFTADETRRLVRHVAGRLLSDRQVEALLARTGGWAVALHLAAFALRVPVDADAVIESLTGEDRDLAGYVGAEVLDRLPARVRRFLARTSVLDRLSASLCDDVAGRPDGDGEAVLALVEQQGLFVRRAARGQVGSATTPCSATSCAANFAGARPMPSTPCWSGPQAGTSLATSPAAPPTTSSRPGTKRA